MVVVAVYGIQYPLGCCFGDDDYSPPLIECKPMKYPHPKGYQPSDWLSGFKLVWQSQASDCWLTTSLGRDTIGA